MNKEHTELFQQDYVICYANCLSVSYYDSVLLVSDAGVRGHKHGTSSVPFQHW